MLDAADGMVLQASGSLADEGGKIDAIYQIMLDSGKLLEATANETGFRRMKITVSAAIYVVTMPSASKIEITVQ